MSKYARRPSASIPDGDADTKMVRIKVTSIGDGGVGKSCLIKRYCEEKFVPRYISTIGVDFGVKPVVIDGLEIKVNFWDFSGHPEFFEVRNEFYKDTQGKWLAQRRRQFVCHLIAHVSCW
jgi:GTPase SAR1 family protein